MGDVGDEELNGRALPHCHVSEREREREEAMKPDRLISHHDFSGCALLPCSVNFYIGVIFQLPSSRCWHTIRPVHVKKTHGTLI